MTENKALATAEQNMVAEISPFQARANELLQRAKGAKVTNEQEAAAAVALKKEITGHRSLVNQTRLGITRQIDTLKKAIIGKEAEVLQPLEDAQAAVGAKVLAYQDKLERERREEQERIDKAVQRVSCGNVYALKTVAEVEAKGEQIKGVYSQMSAADQKDSRIKLAFTESVNKLIDRKTYLVEQARQEAERAELDAKEAKLAAQKRRQDAKDEKQRRQEEQEEIERKADADRRAAELAEKNQVKTGVRTLAELEITNPDLVPREFCSPDLAKVRAALKAHTAGTPFEVPGIKITVTKKL